MSFNTIFLIIWNVFWLGFAAYMLATTGRRIYLHDKSYKLYNKAVALLESKIARGQVSRLESIGIRHNLLNMYLGDKSLNSLWKSTTATYLTYVASV